MSASRRGTSWRAPLLAALSAMLLLGGTAGCSRDDARSPGGSRHEGSWIVDWMADGTRPVREHDTAGIAADHPRAWAVGCQPLAERDENGEAFRWSDGARSRLLLSAAVGGSRTLVLEGFPFLWSGGPPSQRVTVSLNGRLLGGLAWSDRAAQRIQLPDSLLLRGENVVDLGYATPARPCDVLAGNTDCRTLAMAWTRAALAVATTATTATTGEDVPAADSLRTQSAPSVWWRWSALPPSARLRARGTAAAGGAAVEVAVRDAGVWHPLQVATFRAGQTVALDFDVGRASAAAVAPLGLVVRTGVVRWESIELSLPPPTGARRRPIVLVTLDTTRREALTAFAPPPGAPADVALPPPAHRTPALDQVARGATRFDHAYAPIPATAPSHATMLLSRLPIEHGLTVNGLPMPDAGAGHLATRLQAWGYTTAAFVSLGVIDRHTRFDTGFDTFDADFDLRWWRFADEVNRAAFPWIQRHVQHNDATPAFLWVHYSDPHHPYGLREDRGRGLVARLDGAVIDTVRTAAGIPWEPRLQLAPGRHVLRWEAPAHPPQQQFEQGMERAWAGLRYAVWSLSVEGPGLTWFKGAGFETHAQEGLRDAAEIVIDVAPQGAAGTPVEVALRMVCSDIVSPQLRRERYWQEAAAMDRAFGALWSQLDASNWLDDAVVVIVGDHGEDLGEEGRWGHIHHVGPTLTRVPLLLWQRGIDAGTSDLPVGLIDLAPTITARLGLPADASWTGVDLLGSPAPRPLYLETFPPDARAHRRGIVQGGYVIGAVVPADGSPLRGLELFDLARDPYCRDNLLPIVEASAGGDSSNAAAAGRPPAELAGIRAAWQTLRPALERWLDSSAPAGRSDDPALLERLRALGYAQ